VATYWQQIQAQVQADRAVRSRILAGVGLAGLLRSPHPSMRWKSPVLTLHDGPTDRDLDLTRRQRQSGARRSLNALPGRTRAAALATIARGCTTSELAVKVGTSAASASEHATVLREAGLIETRRQHRTAHQDGRHTARRGTRGAPPSRAARPGSTDGHREPAGALARHNVLVGAIEHVPGTDGCGRI
jgi:DNA-binding transcriptional ArsR family regulator